MPPEAVKEHVDTMEELAGPVPSATGGLDAEFQEDRNELKQEENGTYTDPDLLSYSGKLCSQEACITKGEAVIHPRFLADLLSPGP
ncbi:NUT family member 2G [Camelus dromedarius]|uniref:NUT family member 2G n=1 Tax=Camelus dromedarius TaxID=9838 RepID=A0A5N4DKM9_CAMDR|nr:NUT family member 2G [Camelus dromedarius]